MANQTILEDIETGGLILQVNTKRTAGDPFILPAALATLVQTRLDDATSANAAATLIEGDTVGASVLRAQSLGRLGELERNGYNYIKSIPSEDLSDDDRAEVFTAYGWTGGLLGDMESPDRIVTLAGNVAIVGTATTVPAAGKYPATLATRIANWLTTYKAASLVANGGDRQVVYQARNDAGKLLGYINSRVRYFYCTASDETDSTPELARIGMQPKRDPGEAESQPHPDAPGTATFHAAARELTIPEMPKHGTFLRAYRQPAGGPETIAGVSTDTTVSVVGFVPLTPGVVYEVWIVPANSRGEGPASNKISFTA